ncbi:MAG TPA: hypothetical protein VF323_07930 [Candidatus Limnocylindrales bacterium]
MPVAIVAPLLIFLALAGVFGVLIRRASRLLRITREADLFRVGLTDLAARVDRSLAGVVELVDAVRRHQRDASTIQDNLAAAIDAMARYGEEAAALTVPLAGPDRRTELIHELDRAGRALEMISHGCELMATASRPNAELEAQTSVKRGYLNLIHAREAVGRLASEAIALATPAPRPLFKRGVR